MLGWEAGEIQTSSDKQFPSSWVVFLEAASIQGVGELLWLGKMQRTVGQHPKWVVLCPLQLLTGLGWAEHLLVSVPLALWLSLSRGLLFLQILKDDKQSPRPLINSLNRHSLAVFNSPPAPAPAPTPARLL